MDKITLKASCKYRLVHSPETRSFKLLEFYKHRKLTQGMVVITCSEEFLIDLLVGHYQEEMY